MRSIGWFDTASMRTRFAMALIVLGLLDAKSFGASSTELAVPFHPDWFLFEADRTDRDVLFRAFAYEGANMRNVFVLHCPPVQSVSVSVEIIPPTWDVAALEKNASFGLRRSQVTLSSPSAETLTYPGEFDKVAAFIDLPSTDELKSFLSMIAEREVSINVEAINLSWRFVRVERLRSLFPEMFPERAAEIGKSWLSWQDVYVYCGQLRSQNVVPKP
jgi:hypothetical protein